MVLKKVKKFLSKAWMSKGNLSGKIIRQRQIAIQLLVLERVTSIPGKYLVLTLNNLSLATITTIILST